MIDISADGFNIKLINLDAISAADIKPLPGRATREEEDLHRALHEAAARNAKRKASSAASAAVPSRPLPVAPPPPAPKPRPVAIAAVKAAGAAEERRCRMILARAPDSMRSEALAAIKAGHSLEKFDASIPVALKHYLPPLAAFVAQFSLVNSAKVAPKASTAAEDEAAARSILSAYRAASAHAVPRRS